MNLQIQNLVKGVVYMKKDNCKTYSKIIAVLVVLILILITGLVIMKAAEMKAVSNLEDRLKDTQEKLIEVQQQLEAYSDNYVALWNTINNQ